MELTIKIDDKKVYDSFVQFFKTLGINIISFNTKEKTSKKQSRNKFLQLKTKKVKENDRISIFYNLVKKYNQIEEPELDVNELYKNRSNNNERQFDFNWYWYFDIHSENEWKRHKMQQRITDKKWQVKNQRIDILWMFAGL